MNGREKRVVWGGVVWGVGGGKRRGVKEGGGQLHK